MTIKKVFFYILLIFSLLAFSCASKPKIEQEPLNEPVVEENEQSSETAIESEESNDNESENENNDFIDDSNEEEMNSPDSENQSDIETDDTAESGENELEEEKIEADDLDYIPEIEEFVEIAEDEPELNEEPTVIDEPASDEIENNEESENSEATLSSDNSENKETLLKNEESEPSENGNTTENNEDINDSFEPETETTEDVNVEEISEESDEESQAAPVPSRSITIGKNQLIDIVYPGKGWIYQGNIDSEGNIDSKNKNFIFGGRKLGGQDQSFTLRSRQPGSYLLHFYKDDVLTGSYIDDYLEVIVEDKQAETTDHITVPSYAEVVPPKISITAEKVKEQQKKQQEQQMLLEKEQKQQEEIDSGKAEKTFTANKTANATNINKEKEESISTTVQTTESSPTSSSPVVKNTETRTVSRKKNDSAEKKDVDSGYSDSQLDKIDEENLLKTAQNLYDSKDFVQALRVITKFFEKSSTNMDKGLYLQGQILEEKSSVQNIKDAVESYDLLVKNHPDSPLSDKAKKRSIYLKRFYINIR